ncbi:hypothetical protein LTR36_006278 [Oleoguttula mirabilis]|uniref:Uncharacterized protein n=1 Tax=Oleoguttula mirabilis TaxID=1507867 RepID=A0AAV9JC41_9PEZI|nr:hypothetical protein LTR36_006278 [Oleoguttula mirabilis]
MTEDQQHGSFNFAAHRLAQEARQALSFGSRGVKDVTAEFATAAKQLQPGQLVKDDYFTLFEAVGALEIMDPKMDSGCVPEDDSFEAEFDVCRGLEAAEIIWILDELLCLEAAWHDGYPLSQTVFTSLHVDRLLSPDNNAPYNLHYDRRPAGDLSNDEQLVHIVLRAYCLALIKCSQLVLHTVQSQNFYEEEDFVTHLFGRELLPKLSTDECYRLLDDALRFITTLNLPADTSEALKARLAFRRNYLAALIDDTDDWPDLIARMEVIDSTNSLGRPLREAFSDKVQRQLATSTPPRPMLQVSWKDAYARWTKMCAGIIETERLTSFWICQSPHCLQRAMWAFSYLEPQPNTFARAYLQDRLFGSDRITEDVSHFDLLLTDIRDLVLAGDPLADPDSFQVELPSDPRHQCSRHIEAFMDKAFEEYLNVYRMVCQNRCRIRRTFTQAIPIMDALETEAIRTDEELNRLAPREAMPNKSGAKVQLNPLTTWTKFYKVQIMARTIQLGFETEIYLPDELCTMYWLLSVFAHHQCSRIEAIERHLLVRTLSLLDHPQQNSRYAAECMASRDWLRSLHLQWDATRMMALALWRLCGILMAVRIIEAPKRDFAQDQLLYDARMKPYLSVNNEPIPSLQDLDRARQNIKSVEVTCKSIEMDVKEAKAHLAEVKMMSPEQAKYVGTEEQWKREMKQLETTCVAIAVQASQLMRIAGKHGKKGAQEGDSLKETVEASIPPPEKRYHGWWVVPQLKERKM